MTRVLIAGGGTGGHVFPMLAVGAALRAEEPGVEVAFVGTGRGIEARVVPAQGDELHTLDVLPLRGRGLRGLLRGAWRAFRVLPEARALVRRLDPDVVFSVGGYAAGPVVLAAWSLGVPVTLLEPNAVLGFTNRLLVPLVARMYTGFPELAPRLARTRVRHLGVPLRRRFEPRDYVPRAAVRVLVLGGSQGAVALNEAVPRALAALAPACAGLSVVHQTGSEREAGVTSLYRELGLGAAAEVRGFIDDMASELAAADLVIARAGASSLSELCAVGRAAVLVPYPFAADDHQRHNAESLVHDGAAVCVLQREATSERLSAVLRPLVTEGAARAALAAGARARGRPDAAHDVARDLLALGREPRAARRRKNDNADAERGRKAPRPAARRSPETARLGSES